MHTQLQPVATGGTVYLVRGKSPRAADSEIRTDPKPDSGTDTVQPRSKVKLTSLLRRRIEKLSTSDVLVNSYFERACPIIHRPAKLRFTCPEVRATG